MGELVKLRTCCADMSDALKDGAMKVDPYLGFCIVVRDSLSPIFFCPWCSRVQPKMSELNFFSALHRS